MQNKSIEKFEFSKTEIANNRCRVALFANDSHSYMGLLDHTHIISSISYS
jgi:hypothetical protein